MTREKLPKIIFSNIVFLIIFIFPIEFLLGNWKNNFFGKNKYIQIPGLIKNSSIRYDVSRIFKSNKPIIIKYYRDELGYRSRNIETNKPIILTIGGSTTDNKFVTEGKTWQDNLDKLSPQYDFINGGIDGQSTYGHLKSIESWHSKYLKNFNLKKIIFYIGINDISLLNKNISKFDSAQSRMGYVKNLLKDNSFFTIKILSLRDKVDFYFGKLSGNYLNVHKPRTMNFAKEGVRFEYDEKLIYKSNFYRKTFAELLIQTKNSFPNSQVIVVQQQIPGCNFINRNVVYDRHPKALIHNKCLELLKVFKIQEEILKKEKFYNVKSYPMFLNKILNDKDVYDYIHTNNKGALKISNYINLILEN